MTNSEEKTCVVCGNPAGLMCQRCGEPYCRDGCQRLDWQRHKHVCIIMPPLVSIWHAQQPLNPIKSLEKAMSNISLEESPAEFQASTPDPAPKLNQTSVESCSVGPKEEELSNIWREHFLPQGEEFFECRVTFIEKDGPIWVVHIANVKSMERLADNLQRCMQQQKLVRLQNVKEDILVAINVDNKVHRGQVLTVDEQKEEADVRMIDYGPVVATSFCDIYSAVPNMAKLKAHAFRVKLPTNTGVQVNKNLTLRLLGTKTHQGVYHVHLKPKMTIPLSLPLEMLQLNPEVKVIRVFEQSLTRNEPLVALLQINVLDHINKDLNASLAGKPGQPFTGPFPEEKCTFFVAARTKDGYRRAFLLDHIARPTPTFLVYEMDEGRVSITDEVSRIPSELLGLPIRVFAAQLKDSVPKELESDGADLTVKLKLDNTPPKEKIRAADAVLLARGQQICMARLSTFLGQISDLGHKYWREPIENNAQVVITHVDSYKKVYISSQDSKNYPGIFKRLESKCTPFQDSSEVSFGCVVLVTSKLGCFRGEVLGTKDDNYIVKNIDTGATQNVDLTAMRMSCRFLENLPVCLMGVQLKTVCNIPDAAVPANNAAIQMLHNLCVQEEKLTLEIVDAGTSTVDLLSNFGDMRSLVNQMLPLMFTPVKEGTPATEPKDALTPAPSPVASPVNRKKTDPVMLEAAIDLPPLPPSPPVSPIPVNSVNLTQETATKEPFERFFFNAMPKYLVPVGNKIPVILLNAFEMSETGYITACFFENGQVAEKCQNLLNLVVQHGACEHNVVPGYEPGVGEVCLALFNEDKSWYRGVCQDVKDKVAKILYCDFGNIEYVGVEDLKPIPEDLLSGVYATKCYIAGFDKSKNFKALAHFLVHTVKFECDVEEGPEPDTRVIRIPNMENILDN
ncbi:uncharacterized protein LOC108092124 [Drosophila ficusphila]|uniref:uncharacterized protein LOC108092124 n=1 Tax=Drosophila ficusphila TaxID=30025 RepID=UPI0007E6F1F4|nr:uncharacterized protein LOC108092124 [Drosophila ficusphila]XP_017047116.1 uncharacterized protein LOC108092124 [Drosophila ficusphila]